MVQLLFSSYDRLGCMTLVEIRLESKFRHLSDYEKVPQLVPDMRDEKSMWWIADVFFYTSRVASKDVH